MEHKKPDIVEKYWFIPPVVLSIITIFVYRPSFHYNFQFDDVANITKHFHIRHHTFTSLFFTGSRWLSYWLNSIHYSIGKFDPFSYRLGNALIHSTNGLLVFLVLFFGLKRLHQKNFFQIHSFAIALVTSTLFLLHPVHTQTVSYVIQGELEGMAALFSLSTILCFLLFTSTHRMVSKIIVGITMYTLALFACGTKEITIMIPALLLLIDWFFVAQGSWQDLKKRTWVHVLMIFSVFAMYSFLLKPKFFAELFGLKMIAKNNIGNVITKDPTAQITPLAFCISQFKVILHYLWIFIWPFNISVEYDWMLSDGFFAPDAIIPFMVLTLLTSGIMYLLHHNRINPVAFGALWFGLAVAPRSSIIPSPELLVDYKTYLPSIGWLFLLAAGIIKLYEYTRNALPYHISWLTGVRGHAILALLLALPLGYATQQRNLVWSSGLEFWGNIIKNAPGKARAYNNYGVELSQELGKFAEAIPYFKKAIAMDKKYPDPCNNLAVAYARTNDIDNAIEAMKQGLRINQAYPEGYNNLASFFLTKKDYANAKQSLEFALKLRPYYGKAFYNLGRVYMAEGNQEKAWECFKNCCMKGDLDNEIGFRTYAQTSLTLQKYTDAIIGYCKLLEINPTDRPARFNLANCYYLTGEFEKALQKYQQLYAQDPTDEMLIYNIGETYARLGYYDKAIEYLEKTPRSRQRGATRLAECYKKTGQFEKAKNIVT